MNSYHCQIDLSSFMCIEVFVGLRYQPRTIKQVEARISFGIFRVTVININ